MQQQNFNADDDAEEEKKEDKIAASINSWMERRRAVRRSTIVTRGMVIEH